MAEMTKRQKDALDRWITEPDFDDDDEPIDPDKDDEEDNHEPDDDND